MVLRRGLLQLGLVLAALGVAWPAFAADTKALDEAVRLLKDKKYEAAHLKIEGAYDLKDKSVPAKAVFVGCASLVNLQRWDDASLISRKALADREILPFRRLTLDDDELGLLWCYAESQAQIYHRDYDKLSPDARRSLKGEVLHVHGFLTKTSYNAEATDAILPPINTADDLHTRLHWRRKVQILLSYMSWEEDSRFFTSSGSSAGHSEVLTPCVGGALSFSNLHYDFAGGGCFGLGTAHSGIDAADFDSDATVEVISVFGKFMRKFSETGSGLGLQAGILNRQIIAHTEANVAAKASELDFQLLAVGRMSFKKVFFDFKGGSLVGQPSAFWAIELGFNI